MRVNVAWLIIILNIILGTTFNIQFCDIPVILYDSDAGATVDVQCFFKPHAKIKELYIIVLTNGNNVTVSEAELHSNGSAKLGPLHPGNYLVLVYEKNSKTPPYYQKWILIQDTNSSTPTMESSSFIPTTTPICMFNTFKM